MVFGHVARAGFAVFAIASSAFDSMIGLGTGTLVAIAGTDPARTALVQDYWWHRLFEPVVGLLYLSTALGWVLAIGATAVAQRRGGSSFLVVGLLAASGLLAVDHTLPFGTAAMLALLAATALTRVGVRPKLAPAGPHGPQVS